LRAVITGGAGFLGSHLCELMLEKGWDVLCLDNLVTGNQSNVAHLLPHPRFRFAHQDVTRYIEVQGPVEAVLHFASPASPPDYLKFPIQTLKVGALGTHNTLGLAMAKKARFFLASTSECYGDPQVSPQPETYWGHVNPIGIRGCRHIDLLVEIKDGTIRIRTRHIPEQIEKRQCGLLARGSIVVRAYVLRRDRPWDGRVFKHAAIGRVLRARHNGSFRDPGRDQNRRDPHAEAIERECRAGSGVRRGRDERGVRCASGWRNVIVNTPMLVINDQQRGAQPQRFILKDSVVNGSDKNLACLNIVIGMLVRCEQLTTPVAFVIAVIGLDKTIVGKLALIAIR